MESIVTFECRPEFKDLIFIEGLPGVGNVGKIAADFISYKLDAKRLATIVSSELPPQVFIDSDSYFYSACNELWYVTPQGQFELYKLIFEKILPFDPKLIITLGGYGLGEVVKDPRVLAVCNDSKLKSMLEKKGATFQPNEPQGGIIGAAAMFLILANEYDIDAACLMGETSGFLLDHKSAKCVVDVLCKVLGVELDTSDMQEDIQQVEQINEEVQAMAETTPEDLSYIG